VVPMIAMALLVDTFFSLAIAASNRVPR